MREYSLNIALSLNSVLSAAQITQLVHIGTKLHLEPGEVLYHQGDCAHHVYLLIRGRMKTFMVNSAGGESLLRIHLSNSLLGLSAMTSTRTRDASAIAIGTAQLVMITRDDVVNLLRIDATFGIGLIQLLLDRLSDFHMRVGEISTNRVEQRLARALLSISRPDTETGAPDNDKSVPLTHEELAQMINSRRQTVTAALRRFAQAGLITYKGRNLVVVDRARLNGMLPE